MITFRVNTGGDLTVSDDEQFAGYIFLDGEEYVYRADTCFFRAELLTAVSKKLRQLNRDLHK